MRWIEEPNKHNPKSPYQALITEPGEPLAPAFVEYWKRILSDGIPLPPADRYSLAIEIVARKFKDDPSPGNVRASSTIRSNGRAKAFPFTVCAATTSSAFKGIRKMTLRSNADTCSGCSVITGR